VNTGQASQEIPGDDEIAPIKAPSIGLLPSLAVAVICTGLIVEAIVTVFHGRANGDLLLMVCPILGVIFLSIPTAQAWWKVIGVIRSSHWSNQTACATREDGTSSPSTAKS
jgi:hypothetical protein